MMKLMCLVPMLLAVASLARSAPPAAPTFQELMDPALFPDPQRGMKVEGAAVGPGGVAHVQALGATVAITPSRGEIVFHQRIGHPRPMAVLRFAQPITGVRVVKATAGYALLAIAQPKVTIRVNGDSLFMLQPHEPVTLKVDREIDPAWHASYGSNHLLADEWGAFGLYCSEREAADQFDPYAGTVATYSLPAEAVLWVGVCPPKPYDWERSLRDNVVWHWSNTLAYPPDDVLRSWKPYGNTVLLQSEVMLWKDWNLDFVPRLGVEELARVRQTIHDLGMRFIVYTSPFYFLKGTPLEGQALNSFEGFKGWPPGCGTGENMELLMAAITKVMREYQPDGLYFDGQYGDSPAALYALARRARQVIGEAGILEWHSTWALGPPPFSLPQADAYVDFILRGEGQDQKYTDYDYLRFFVSGYNVHNSIGVICNNGSSVPAPKLCEDVLRVNGRFHAIAGWLDRPELVEVLERDYRAHLTPQLRETVEREIDARQAEVAKRAEEARAEREALRKPPSWGEPVFAEEFATLPQADQVVSPQNDNPFSVADGSLHIRGRAHTYAFLRIPLKVRASGFVVRLRQDTDDGMSWGPAAMLRWGNGAGVRIGARSDGKLQSDVSGNQQLGGEYRPSDWVWLRARWGKSQGVVEWSNDGADYHHLWSFDASGLSGETVDLLVGKVPYNGQPQDYIDPGAVGECELDCVGVYAR